MQQTNRNSKQSQECFQVKSQSFEIIKVAKHD